MKKWSILICCLLSVTYCLFAQVVHPKINKTVQSADGRISIELIGKKQFYDPSEEATADSDINSPKSVNVHPNGKKFYVNSLEGATTVVYDFQTYKKLAVIKHQFDHSKDAHLWSKPSGLYPFTHYQDDHLNTFYGKPVESTFTHGGRYLWVPYYRRSYDINAQDPSAVAVIDTETDQIVRLMETGPLPKMIATSPDGQLIAVSHWGNNTVGLIDISSESPKLWKHITVLTVDKELILNFPLDRSVDRDNNSGYALRGTVFTPDGKFLLVGCMGGGGGIAIIDVVQKRYLGRLMGMLPNVRHLIISNGYLYLSINGAGVIQRVRLEKFLEAAIHIKNKVGDVKGWESCHVGRGARTISLSPDGRYVFAACNNVSQLYVVDTRTMKVIACIDVDSYPVGLDISSDGRYLFTTSQGRNNSGGNAVDIFEVTYSVPLTLPVPSSTQEEKVDSIAMNSATSVIDSSDNHILIYGVAIIVLVLLIGMLGWRFSKRTKLKTLTNKKI